MPKTLSIDIGNIAVEAEEDFQSPVRYDQNLERLTRHGYQRNLTPAEYFNLFFNSYEHCPTHTAASYSDTPASYIGGLGKSEEWLSLAVQKQGNILTCYLNPKGLVWNEEVQEYAPQQFTFSEKREFTLPSADERWLIITPQTNPELVKCLFGREYAAIPQTVLEKHESWINLPEVQKVYFGREGEDLHQAGCEGCEKSKNEYLQEHPGAIYPPVIDALGIYYFEPVKIYPVSVHKWGLRVAQGSDNWPNALSRGVREIESFGVR